MDEKDLATLKETMQIRKMHPGLTGKKKDPVLVHVRNMPDIAYCSLVEFVERLEKRGKTVDLHTLEIKDAKAPATTPPPTVPKTTTKKPVPKTGAGKDGIAPTKSPSYTKAALEKMKVVDLRKIAGVDPDVNMQGKKAELVMKLTGRPKFPLK